MNQLPKFSVIVPTHNHAQFLPECLNSIKSQTFSDFEVIVINNGSTDNTEEIIQKFFWEKIRYHYQDDTGSVAGPRNTGIKLAQGEFVAFLDSDDIWYPDKLERVFKVFEKYPDIDIISHSLYLVRPNKPKKSIKVGPAKKNMYRTLLMKNRLLGSATVAKRSVLLEVNGFDGRKEFVHAEDYETWLRLAYLNKKFFFLDDVLGEYRIHASNLSSNFKEHLLHEKNVVDKHFKNLKINILLKALLYSQRICVIYFKLGVQYFFRKEYKKAFQFFLLSFIINPFNFFINLYKFLIRTLD